MVHHQFSFHPEHIPRELKAGRFWVCCDQDKVPQVPGTRRRASSTNPATWRSYAEAAAWFADGHHAGIGRVIAHGNPYVGVDLDGVRDPDSRLLDPRAVAILDALNSYSEVSPSGRGVKVWIRARLDRSYVKPGLEVYTRCRYFVTTGQLLPQYPATVQDRQEEIVALVEQEFPTPGRGASAVTGVPYAGPRIDLARYLDRVEVLAEIPNGLGVKFAIRCPWIAEHTDGDISGTYIGQRADGGFWFHCHHAHCAGRDWRDFRDRTRRNVIYIARRAGRPDHERRVNLGRG